MSRAYLLKDLRILNPQSVTEGDIRVKNGRIVELGQRLPEHRHEEVLWCSGLSACPGLINAHDHLQFNLYPRIGNPPYGNAYEWGDDIRTSCRATVDKIERIPIRLRYRWGAWKNLLSGVTRVAHHDPYSLYCRYLLPIDIHAPYTFAHSLGNEENLKEILAKRGRSIPFIIHLAEGTDDITASEVAVLMRLGGLDARTVAVHAVNVNQRDIDLLAERQASVVWCPSSNRYLFKKTAPIDSMWGTIAVALGTDSTLTGSTTMFDEMRAAKDMSSRSSQDIVRMVTDIPKKIFNLPFGAGEIVEGGRADLFLVPSDEADPYRAIIAADPASLMLMMKQGDVLYYDATKFQLPFSDRKRSIAFRGRRKIFTHKECINLIHTLDPFLHHYRYIETP